MEGQAQQPTRPTKAVAPRTGIIDRLKAATDKADVLSIAREFAGFTHASDKTKRRVERLLYTFSRTLDLADQLVLKSELLGMGGSR